MAEPCGSSRKAHHEATMVARSNRRIPASPAAVLLSTDDADHLTHLPSSVPTNNLIGGLLLDVVGLFLFGVVLLALLARLSPLPRRIVSASFTGFFIWRVAGIARSLIDCRMSGSPTTSGAFGIILFSIQ